MIFRRGSCLFLFFKVHSSSSSSVRFRFSFLHSSSSWFLCFRRHRRGSGEKTGCRRRIVITRRPGCGRKKMGWTPDRPTSSRRAPVQGPGVGYWPAMMSSSFPLPDSFAGMERAREMDAGVSLQKIQTLARPVPIFGSGGFTPGTPVSTLKENKRDSKRERER